MVTIKEKALAYLYRELRAARIALGRAESKPNVQQKELDDLNSRIELLEWTASLVLKEDSKDA